MPARVDRRNVRDRQTSTLAAALRAAFASATDPARAPAMQAYMKSNMPFRGVPTPERRRLVRAVLADVGAPADRPTWEAVVLDLWDHAAFREERYAAIDLCAHRSAGDWQTAQLLPLYDHMIVTGAWWDLVDAIAIPLLGPILRAEPAAVEPAMRAWTIDPDRWRRRASIIVQNGAKSATDTELLAEAIIANAADRDFFIRKAIGWALREYAKTDPGWVRAFVGRHATELSPLSRHEATRNRC